MRVTDIDLKYLKSDNFKHVSFDVDEDLFAAIVSGVAVAFAVPGKKTVVFSLKGYVASTIEENEGDPLDKVLSVDPLYKELSSRKRKDEKNDKV